jgi:hypothetical protein
MDMEIDDEGFGTDRENKSRDVEIETAIATFGPIGVATAGFEIETTQS